MKLLQKLFARFGLKLVKDEPAAIIKEQERSIFEFMNSLSTHRNDFTSVNGDGKPEFIMPEFPTAKDFPIAERVAQTFIKALSLFGDRVPRMTVGDARLVVGDDGAGGPMMKPGGNMAIIAPALAAWYNSQSFIGYQMCAIIAQHWLIDKACSQAGIDAVRNGYALNRIRKSKEDESEPMSAKPVLPEQKQEQEIARKDKEGRQITRDDFRPSSESGASGESEQSMFEREFDKKGEQPAVFAANDEPEDSQEQKAAKEAAEDKELMANIVRLDEKYHLAENMREMIRNANIFGIRIAIFIVDNSDPRYYEKPFNLDGITKGSYKGIHQVDPYYCTPVMTSIGQNQPNDEDFYEPEYWRIGTKLYHKSHLVIMRTARPAQMLQPMYLFGGVPLTQRLYERVYAAERTANEAPLLATSKRTTALYANLNAIAGKQSSLDMRLQEWARYRDNYGVKVMGTNEKLEQYDTSLAEFDTVVMNQFQLVAAICNTPATKLLGTTPKGFNATGEHETKSYHEHLEGVQAWVAPLAVRHHQILIKSEGLGDVDVEIAWNPVDTPTAKDLAEINKKKADTGEVLIRAGAISPDEERQRVRHDKASGYGNLTDEEAMTGIGAHPENLIDLLDVAGSVASTESESITAEATANQTNAMAEAIRQHPEAAVTRPAGGEGGEGGMAGEAGPGGGESSGMGGHAKQGRGGQFKGSTKAAPMALDSALPFDERNGPGGHYPAHVVFGRIVRIENPTSSVRAGSDKGGKEWRTLMNVPYGFFEDTMGADGDEIDVFIGSQPSNYAHVINQVNPETGKFDEHKVVVGAKSENDAIAIYHGAYELGWKGFHSVKTMGRDEFLQWLDNSDKKEMC